MSRRRPRTRRTRTTVLTVVLVAVCVALPWALPTVPDLFARAVPAAPQQTPDPPVAPPEVPGATLSPEPPGGAYAGTRLGAAGAPLEVRVSRLGVRSVAVPISGQSGSLLPPADPQQLGWWREGAEVGAAEGTAVVTGHTVHTGGGALDHLDQLRPGDRVRVRTARGWILYVVRWAEVIDTEALARRAGGLFRRGGFGRLLLITCDDWNGSFYESNAVVAAVPVEDQPYDASAAAVPDGGIGLARPEGPGNMGTVRSVGPSEP